MRVEINYQVTQVQPTTDKIEIIDVYLLDCSGSMGSVFNPGTKLYNAINGIKENVKASLAETNTKNTVIVATFDVLRRLDGVFSPQKTAHPYFINSEKDLEFLNSQASKHGNSTALYDAIGELIEFIRTNHPGKKVIFKIFTDGKENASHKFKVFTIKEMISKLENEGWTFTFVGTELDVKSMVKALNIEMSNTLVHDNTAKGMLESMEVTRGAMKSYSTKVAKGLDVSKDFYKK